MTIFLAVCKETLQREIRRLCTASKAADNSIKNKVLSFAGLGRDQELSNTKQQLANTTLWAQIMALEDQDTDKLTLDKLSQMIDECRRAAAQSAQQKGLGEGSFRDKMMRIQDLLKSFFEKLEQQKLLDISVDNDPLNVFRYYAAAYFAIKTEEAEHVTTLQRAAQNPAVSSAKKIADEKTQLIQTALDECIETLGTLNNRSPNYETVRKRLVLQQVHLLIQANRELCDSSPQMELGVWTVKASYGLLDALMSKAREDICSGRAPVAVSLNLESAALPTGKEVTRDEGVGEADSSSSDPSSAPFLTSSTSGILGQLTVAGGAGPAPAPSTATSGVVVPLVAPVVESPASQKNSQPVSVKGDKRAGKGRP